MRIALLLLFLILAMARTTLACDCFVLDEKESFRRAELVFEGEVVRIAGDNQRPVYTFAVQKLLKGSAVREVNIYSTGSNCDSDFSPNIIYRVHARRYEGKLISGQCSGNKVLKTKKAQHSHLVQRINTARYCQ